MQSTTRAYLQDLARSPNLLLACNLYAYLRRSYRYVCLMFGGRLLSSVYMYASDFVIALHQVCQNSSRLFMLKPKQSNMYRSIMISPFCKMECMM